MRRWIGIGLILICPCVKAQWLDQPTPGAPRKLDGKVDMVGPAPRANGKPDLSGVWQVLPEPRPSATAPFGLGESPNSKYFRDILSDFKAGEEPLTAAGREAFRQHSQPGVIGPGVKCLPEGVPHADLLPEPFKIVQLPGEILILYEVQTIFRQIFTDGRKYPADPSPTWFGYSLGQWEGDTLVVKTLGFNDLTWLDAFGHGHSEDMRVEERFHRVDFGHMDVTATITDPKMFERPVTIHFVEELLPDTDVFEHICYENEKDAVHHVGITGR